MTVKRPRRNWVTPFGTLERLAARGAMMGNRGDLHDRNGEIVRQWKVRAWIACSITNATGYRVTFDTPGHYAPLFTLDEATMLAAGHRPCAQCRRDAFRRFKAAWASAYGGNDLPATAIDAALHAARLDDAGRQRTFRARLGDLPDGVMVVPETSLAAAERGSRAVSLLWHGHTHPWSHDGYGRPSPAAPDTPVEVLTPEPIVAILRAGYVPTVAL